MWNGGIVEWNGIANENEIEYAEAEDGVEWMEEG